LAQPGIAPAPGFTPAPQPGGFTPVPQPGGFAPVPQPGGFGNRQPGGFANQQPGTLPGFQQDGFQPFQQGGFGDAVQGPQAGTPAKQRSGKRGGKTKFLVGGGVLLVVLAAGGYYFVPRYLNPSDPGCSMYTGTVLSAYNQTIGDLNAQASQSKLTSDMNTAITGLNDAAGQAQSAAVKSALRQLLADLTTVRADVQNGAVPPATVAALNAAANTADKSC
jgi:hypothetical protein